ncbi:MAG TPA: GntR family transcriptional regulator, partial [Candidatus Dormibacteraeota bacterium]|nr:GntR family transcriptional regulator [Candidatus Dormibacteraeota bacterium]
MKQARRDAYHLLREAIVSGQFHPNERLVEATIAERIGAGRTAVRAALVRLDQEGLVRLEHNRGARVRFISDREALEIEEVRAVLEGMLARRAA